ncbi:MAG: RNA methyltransferase [Eggerthellaceae bacterium]|nr:RNA methyltransferase [Eggerthellaceae bacterium]
MPIVDVREWDPQRLAEDPRIAAFAPGADDARLRDHAAWALGLGDAVASGVLENDVREQGLFVAESSKVAHRALDAGIVPWAAFMEFKWLAKSRDLVERILDAHPSVPVFVTSAEQFHQVTGYQVTRGALVAMVRPKLPIVEDVVRGARRIAVLEDVNNYTNIGAIFRSAAALNIDAVLVTPACHDPLFRRAARVSMGTVFQVPWTRIGQVRNWAGEGVPLLHGLGFKTVALALTDDSIPVDDASLAAEPRLALVLGAEGDGLAPETIACCDFTVRIPMRAGVDSLNVAAASAVAFWELRARG